MKERKKIVIYGDSISTCLFGGGGYAGYLKEKFSAEVLNYAISGSGLSLATPENTISILREDKNIPEDADLIIMWHGTNDWYWGSTLGTPESSDSNTFYGAIKEAVERIRKKAPNAVMVWLTPVFRYQMPDGGTREGKAYETKNKAGYERVWHVLERGIEEVKWLE